MLMNGSFGKITQLSELGEDQFEKKKLHRPTGYAANVRLHMGRLCVPILNDSGATCSLLTEEQVVVIINHVMMMTEKGKMKQTDYNYPIVKFFKYDQSGELRGAEKNGRMAVEYAVVMRVEFIPAGCECGPVKEIYFKILKTGAISFSTNDVNIPPCRSAESRRSMSSSH